MFKKKTCVWPCLKEFEYFLYKWNKIINDNKHRKLHDKTLNKDYMMTSFGGTWYEGDDVVSNVIFHVSNIPLFVPYIWLYMYYTGNGQVKWIFF